MKDLKKTSWLDSIQVTMNTNKPMILVQ